MDRLFCIPRTWNDTWHTEVLSKFLLNEWGSQFYKVHALKVFAVQQEMGSTWVLNRDISQKQYLQFSIALITFQNRCRHVMVLAADSTKSRYWRTGRGKSRGAKEKEQLYKLQKQIQPPLFRVCLLFHIPWFRAPWSCRDMRTLWLYFFHGGHLGKISETV